MSRFLLFIVVFAGCVRTNQESIRCIQSDFNYKAREAFMVNVDSYDFSPMTEWEVCILKRGICEYLDEMNDWRLEIVDSFYIRNYHFLDLSTHFSFISAASGEFYFIHLPHLYKYLFGDLYYENSGDYLQLRDSLDFVMARINSPMLDRFLQNEVFIFDDVKKQFAQADHLLSVIFPELLSHEVLLPEFLKELENEPKENYRYVRSFLDPIVSRKQYLSGGAFDFRIYYYDLIGFVFLDFMLDPTDSSKLVLNMYFIPHKYRHSMVRETERRKYLDCYP